MGTGRRDQACRTRPELRLARLDDELAAGALEIAQCRQLEIEDFKNADKGNLVKQDAAVQIQGFLDLQACLLKKPPHAPGGIATIVRGKDVFFEPTGDLGDEPLSKAAWDHFGE